MNTLDPIRVFWIICLISLITSDHLICEPIGEMSRFERSYKALEKEVPNIDSIEERSLKIYCDGRYYSVAQLGEWTKRLTPTTPPERKIAEKFAFSKVAAVRFIAIYAIMNDSGINYSSLPGEISFTHAVRPVDSKEFKNLVNLLKLPLPAE